eukprot:5404482-Amphidinium_carterae.1
MTNNYDFEVRDLRVYCHLLRQKGRPIRAPELKKNDNKGKEEECEKTRWSRASAWRHWRHVCPAGPPVNKHVRDLPSRERNIAPAMRGLKPHPSKTLLEGARQPHPPLGDPD